MVPNYFICDKCEEGRVEVESRVRLADGWDSLGLPVQEAVDLCPTCAALLIETCLSMEVYREWKNRK